MRSVGRATERLPGASDWAAAAAEAAEVAAVAAAHIVAAAQNYACLNSFFFLGMGHALTLVPRSHNTHPDTRAFSYRIDKVFSLLRRRVTHVKVMLNVLVRGVGFRSNLKECTVYRR